MLRIVWILLFLLIQVNVLCAQSNQDIILIDRELEELNRWLDESKIDSIASHLEALETSITQLHKGPSRSLVELLLIKSKYQQILGDFDMAYSYGSSAVEQSTLLNDTTVIISSYDCLARASYYLRKYLETDSLCYISLNLNNALLNLEDEKTADIYTLLGLSHRRKGQTDKAIELHEKSLAINRKVFGDSHPNVARNYGNLANCYQDKDDYFRAIDYLKSTEEIFKKAHGPESQSLATMYYNLAMNYDNIEERDSSIAYYWKAMELRKKEYPEDHVYIGEYWEGIASNYADLQRYDTALYYFKKAKLIFDKKELNQYDASRFSAKIGFVYFRMEDWEKAQKHYERSLDIRLNDFGERDAEVMFYRMMLGGINSSKGEFLEGQAWYDKALAPFHFSAIDMNYSEIPRLKNLLVTLRDKALSNYEWYLQDHNISHLDSAFSTSQEALGLLDYLRSGYREDESRILLNQQYRSIIDQSLAIVHTLYQVTDDERYLDFFFQSLERQKATSMLVQLNEQNVDQGKSLPPGVLDEEQKLKLTLNEAEDLQRSILTKNNDSLRSEVQHNLFDTKREFEKFIKSLSTTAPAYYALKYQSIFPSIVDIQSILDPGEILVSYDLTDNNLFTFYCTNDEKGLLKQELTDEFAMNISVLRDSFFDETQVLHSQERNIRFVDILKSLSEKIIAPIPLERLDIQQICVIPDGILNLIPFDCLLYEDHIGEVTFSTLPYLGMRYDIYSLYSASTFLSNRNLRTKSVASLVAFAPSYSGYEDTSKADDVAAILIRSGHLPLPGAEKEATSISKIWKGRLWKGLEASEANFRKNINDGNIIHLSMHALVDQEKPLNSTLLFAKGIEAQEDGYLYASELYDMSINAAMVVLSACNTGYGKMAEGEGTQSLSRAFAYAGVPSTVMSLWKIPDASSSDLMIDFYKNLKLGMSKPTALAEAKRNYLSNVVTPELAHPFYWAGFIASGDPCPLLAAEEAKMWPWLLLLIMPGLFFAFIQIRKFSS